MKVFLLPLCLIVLILVASQSRADEDAQSAAQYNATANAAIEVAEWAKEQAAARIAAEGISNPFTVAKYQTANDDLIAAIWAYNDGQIEEAQENWAAAVAHYLLAIMLADRATAVFDSIFP